jgi:predicted DNA-binding transcriptional regulator AlpA
MSEVDFFLPELMTAREVAHCLAVSVRTVWRWTALGLLPAPVRPSRRSTRWRRGEIRRYLDGLGTRCVRTG